MAVTRCDCCMGRKIIKGLGNMEKDCPACRGIGWTDEAIKEENDVPRGTLEIPKERKKPGRKPRLINNA